MANLHGIVDKDKIIKGLDVLAYAYELVGIGWIYYPVKVPFISKIIKLIYIYWAKNRLKITGRKKSQENCLNACEKIIEK